MAAKYYTILTKIGAALHANAQITQTTVPWTHLALGDGGGYPVTPKQEQTGLVREVYRLPITAIEAHPDNPNWIVVEAVVPNSVGGFTVRETSIIGGTGGSTIAVGNYPDTYKPVLSEGAVREMVMRMIVEISSTATVNLVIDPAVAIASRAYVDGAIRAELAKSGCKQAVRAAAASNISLAGVKTVDGVALSANDRVLVKGQADAKTNGIYVVAAGNWTRALDADTGEKLKPGAIIPVTEGAQSADTLWTLRTDGAISIGATALDFQWLAGANAPDQPDGDSGPKVANTRFVDRAIRDLADSGRFVLYTPGITEFSIPAVVRSGKKKLWVRGVAGGGSGVASNGVGFCSGGSGGGGFDVLVDLKDVDSVTCTVGGGGPGVSAGNAGRNGTATSFGAYASATGGLGGITTGNLPAGGMATIGNAAVGVVMHGAYAGASMSVPGGGSVGGEGGSSLLGLGGRGTTSGGQTAGFGAGSGGVNGTGIPSQPGGHGVLILEW